MILTLDDKFSKGSLRVIFVLGQNSLRSDWDSFQDWVGVGPGGGGGGVEEEGVGRVEEGERSWKT